MATKKSALSLAIGSAFVASIAAAPIANAADNPFQMNTLDNGYQIGSVVKGEEGKCGEGKCGGDADKGEEGKCGEGKCGGAE